MKKRWGKRGGERETETETERERERESPLTEVVVILRYFRFLVVNSENISQVRLS